MNQIHIKGANQNNLKNISVDIPKHKLTVFTGRSGSGKSSLVFNTVAAESERLMNETYSTYIQNQLTHHEKPEVDQILNLPVAMVINQKRLDGNSRSTVGTISDIYASVRLLWSRLGSPFVGYSSVFSFNNPNGMCEACQGLGYVEDIDLKDRKSTRLNSSHVAISYAVFCLKKKKENIKKWRGETEVRQVMTGDVWARER